MSRLGLRLLILVALPGALALAADGIEVLSHKTVANGIEVLSVSEGARVEAQVLVDDEWTTVDHQIVDADGKATLTFPGLEPGAARIVARGADGDVVASVVYTGGQDWR